VAGNHRIQVRQAARNEARYNAAGYVRQGRQACSGARQEVIHAGGGVRAVKVPDDRNNTVIQKEPT